MSTVKWVDNSVNKENQGRSGKKNAGEYSTNQIRQKNWMYKRVITTAQEQLSIQHEHWRMHTAPKRKMDCVYRGYMSPV